MKLAAPGQIGAGGATISATATADTAAGASVAKVEFFLGNELLCADTAAPYKCKVLPTGAEVGKQALRAVVTDSAKQTASAERGDDRKVRPAGMPIKAKAGKATKGKVARTLSGSLKLPARVTAAEACTSGSVTVSVERGGKTVLPPTQVSLHRDCSWRLRFTASAGSAKFLATAKFGGNAVLETRLDRTEVPLMRRAMKAPRALLGALAAAAAVAALIVPGSAAAAVHPLGCTPTLQYDPSIPTFTQFATEHGYSTKRSAASTPAPPIATSPRSSTPTRKRSRGRPKTTRGCGSWSATWARPPRGGPSSTR